MEIWCEMVCHTGSIYYTTVVSTSKSVVFILQQTGASVIHPTIKEGTRPQQLQQALIKSKPKSGILPVNPLCPQSPSPPAASPPFSHPPIPTHTFPCA